MYGADGDVPYTRCVTNVGATEVASYIDQEYIGRWAVSRWSPRTYG